MKYVVLIAAILELSASYACYKGDPGHGNTDYPPNATLGKGDGGMKDGN